MLEIVRQGAASGWDKDRVYLVRGRQMTLADALHYFNRKGIKDPTTLLDAQNDVTGDVSSPDDDADARTPLSSQADALDAFEDEDYDMTRSPETGADRTITTLPNIKPSNDFVERRLAVLQKQLGLRELKPMPPFRTVPVDALVPGPSFGPEEQRYLEHIFGKAKEHYGRIFTSRNLAVNVASWTATSDDALADKFYYSMYHGYGFLWNAQRDRAFENFYQAFHYVKALLKGNHVAFLIYIFDLVIRHDGTGYEEPLMLLLQHLADMAKLVFQSQDNPIFLIALWLKNATVSRAWLAEETLRKLLPFFQDSIGYFHTETVALLQTLAFGLMNRKLYVEAAARFLQLVDAFETTQGKASYEACYALRSTSEAYFHAEQYGDALRALKAALDRSVQLPRLEEREIHVRCLRGMAEISNKLGQHDEANETMQQVVDCCVQAFGPEHPFTNRARMHKKSLRQGDAATDSAIPPMVYRLGRGGNAAKYIWTTRSSPTRLEA